MTKKATPKLHRWSITLIIGTPARYVGSVYAKDEAKAIQKAISEFKIKEPLRNRIVARREDYPSGLLMFPIIGSVIAGFLIVGWQLLTWLEKAVWDPVTIRTALSWLTGRTIYDDDLATGFFWLDRIVLLSVDKLPLALWLIVILPLVWGATCTAILSGRSNRI